MNNSYLTSEIPRQISELSAFLSYSFNGRPALYSRDVPVTLFQTASIVTNTGRYRYRYFGLRPSFNERIVKRSNVLF
jgi:hypothetical protein